MSRAESAGGQATHAVAEGSPDSLSYLDRSASPLTSLVFLLPFVILYELGTRLLLTDAVNGTQHIVAFDLLQRFFGLLGATGRHLPALALASILIAWHIARKDRWVIRPGTLGGMAAESIAWAAPLIVLGIFLMRFFPPLSAAVPVAGVAGGSATGTVILSLGAGIYEELVFRLMLCTLLALVLRNGLKLSRLLSFLLLVLISSVAFSAYHYLGNEIFTWRNFVFRMVAGIYFTALFTLRGMGVTAGSHMAYDILIVML